MTQSPDTGLVEFGCRWYDAQTGRWLSKDPILLEGGWNVYAFCDNDPVNRTDPSGLWVWVDDAVFAGGGALCGVAGKLLTDLVHLCCGNGWSSTVGDYVGAAVGGAVAGETVLYTGNPFLAGAAGGFVGNAAGQGIDKFTGAKSSFEFVPLLSDTVMGAALGAMGAVKPGVTTGNGSCLHLSKQFRTKLKNGSCHRVSYDTACKMFKGEFYDKALLPGSFASTTWAKDFGLLYAGGAGK